LPTETGRVDVKGAPPGPQMLEPPRYAELPVPANLVESRPSTFSAFSLATFLSELTVMGCSPGSTCNARAGPAPLLSILSMALVALPMRLLILSTVFAWPRLKVAPTPVPANAVAATPNRSPRTTASPTRNTVALPTHITLLAALRIMLCSFSLVGRRRSVPQPGHVTGAAYSPVKELHIPQMGYLWLTSENAPSPTFGK